jgi:DNA-binding response OmpR family regulator
MGFERPVILCVDDSEAGLSLRKAILDQEGYRVFVARNIAQAMRVCERYRISLVIADHMLKGESGMDLAAKVKAKCPGVPIMMISGTQPETLRNIDCFLDKGEPVPTMLALVHDVVQRRRG